MGLDLAVWHDKRGFNDVVMIRNLVSRAAGDPKGVIFLGRDLQKIQKISRRSTDDRILR